MEYVDFGGSAFKGLQNGRLLEHGDADEVALPLEELAFSLAADRATASDVLAIEAVLKTDARDFYRGEYVFHEAVWKASHNNQLLSCLVQLVRPLFIGGFRSIFAADSIDDHRTILGFLKKRDQRRLRQALRDHLAGHWQQVLPGSIRGS